MWVQCLGWEDPLEEGMETHSSILAWRIPWTEEPGGLQSIGCTELDTTEATEHTCTGNTPGCWPLHQLGSQCEGDLEPSDSNEGCVLPVRYQSLKPLRFAACFHSTD